MLARSRFDGPGGAYSVERFAEVRVGPSACLGLLEAAIRDDEPVIFLMPLVLSGMKGEVR